MRRLEVADTPGAGTVVTVTLPQQLADGLLTTQAPARASQRLHPA